MLYRHPPWHQSLFHNMCFSVVSYRFSQGKAAVSSLSNPIMEQTLNSTFALFRQPRQKGTSVLE